MVLGSGFDLDIYIHQGAAAYICGEETALIYEGDRWNMAAGGGRGGPATGRRGASLTSGIAVSPSFVDKQDRPIERTGTVEGRQAHHPHGVTC